VEEIVIWTEHAVMELFARFEGKSPVERSADRRGMARAI